MKNRNGFSLIELIIVLAIMGVLMGFASVGINMLTSQSAKVVSRDVYNMIGSAQTVAMSKGNSYFMLSCDSTGNRRACVLYQRTESDGSTTWVILQEQELSNNCDINLVIGGNSYDLYQTTTGSHLQGVIIPIDRSTGRFQSVYFYSGDDTAPLGSAAADNCTDIIIQQGSRVYDIALVAATGKYYYK